MTRFRRLRLKVSILQLAFIFLRAISFALNLLLFDNFYTH